LVTSEEADGAESILAMISSISFAFGGEGTEAAAELALVCLGLAPVSRGVDNAVAVDAEVVDFGAEDAAVDAEVVAVDAEAAVVVVVVDSELDVDVVVAAVVVRFSLLTTLEYCCISITAASSKT
jgi:hypothetical protein